MSIPLFNKVIDGKNVPFYKIAYEENVIIKINIEQGTQEEEKIDPSTG